MSDGHVTFEDAKRCPFCTQPGDDASQAALPQGHGVMHLLVCRNPLCSSYQETWFVQVLPDGTIPNRLAKPGPPEFPQRSREFYSHGQRIVEDAVGRDLRDER